MLDSLCIEQLVQLMQTLNQEIKEIRVNPANTSQWKGFELNVFPLTYGCIVIHVILAVSMRMDN